MLHVQHLARSKIFGSDKSRLLLITLALNVILLVRLCGCQKFSSAVMVSKLCWKPVAAGHQEDVKEAET